MSRRSTPALRRVVETPAPGTFSAPVASGERDACADDRKTDPPPMTPEEYRQAYIMGLSHRAVTRPRIEAVVEEPPIATLPPAARRGESLARMQLPHPATPSPQSFADPALDDDIPAVLVPRAPLVPALSIPPMSEKERLAASTDRPTALALEVELADRSRVVHHAMAKAHVAAMSLDHRAGFLLSRIDGRMSIEDLLDISGMPAAEAFAILGDLLQRGVIAIEPEVRTAHEGGGSPTATAARRAR